MSPRWYDSNKHNQHCRANSHLLNSGRKSLMNELHPLHLELAANKSHLKSDTATYAVSSELCYSQSHRIFPADLLLSMWYQHPWPGFIRSQWVELSQVTVELMDGNRSRFLWERKMRVMGPSDGWCLVCSLWQVRDASWCEARSSPRCSAAGGHGCTWNCYVSGEAALAELCHHTALDAPYALEQDTHLALATLASSKA